MTNLASPFDPATGCTSTSRYADGACRSTAPVAPRVAMAVDPQRHGPKALVTGAAQGIGAALARSLRRRGLDLILVDRQADRLSALGRSLGAQTVAMDLSARDAVSDLSVALEGQEVGLIVHNAAISTVAPLAETEPAVLEETLAVNARVPLLLTRALLPKMLARRRGGIVFLSSLAALHGAPELAAYSATRGFTLSLGESLWGELRGTGVDVLVACPGATDTEGFRATEPDPRMLRFTPLATPEVVAEEVLDALGSDGPTRLLGGANRAAEAVLGRLPRRLAARFMAANLRRLYRR